MVKINWEEIVFILHFINKAKMAGYHFDIQGQILEVTLPASEYSEKIKIKSTEEFFALCYNIVQRKL